MIKVKELIENASDAQKRGKNPQEAWDNAKNVKEMDDAGAWGINDITSSKLGDVLQKAFKEGTLTRFIQAISWEDLYRDNVFTNFLRANSYNFTSTMVKLLKKDEKELENLYKNNANKDQIISRIKNTKELNSADDMFQLLYNGSLDGLFKESDSIEDAISSCIEGKDITTKNIKNATREHSIDDYIKNMSSGDKVKLRKAIDGFSDMSDQDKFDLGKKIK